ncbi:hypothetical protein HDU91_004827 [Kappamyces sp. JEL0680]|nr:hypothetical protein HDU91_004827 [Kappamyces sp. JEL0680]
MSVSVANSITNATMAVSSPIYVVSNSSTVAQNAIIGGTKLSATSVTTSQQNSYSTWDLVFTTWPAATGFGNWYYYCPDSKCGAVGWTLLTTPTSLPYSWIVMSAVKFVPSVGSSGTTTVNATAQYGSYLQNVTLSISVQSSYVPPTYATPYANAISCDGNYGKLKSSGVDASNLNYPWTSLYYTYVANSPIRPLCMSGSGASGSSFALGDLTVYPSDTNPIYAYASYAIDSSLLKPTGFTPLWFTGSTSTNGYIENAIGFSGKSNFTIVTPQVNLDFVSNITSTANVGALVYSKDTGTSYYLPASRWNTDTASPFRITISVPGTALYIFGYLDNSLNTVLPAYFGQTMYYVGAWGSKAFSFCSSSGVASDFSANITYSGDLAFLVTPFSVIADASISVLGAWSVAFTGTPQVVLSYPNNTGYVWAAYQQAQTATGYAWSTVGLATSSNSTVFKTTISSSGIYGLVKVAATSGHSPMSPAINATAALAHGPLSNSVDDYYLDEYAFVKDEKSKLDERETEASPAAAAHTGLYPKFRDHDASQYEVDNAYQSQVIQTVDQYTSAPAAFGAYQASPPVEYGADYHHHQSPSLHYSTDYSFNGYFYDHPHYGSEAMSTWMSRGYEDSFEFPTHEKDDAYAQYMRELHSHVDPSILDGASLHTGFLMESGQTLAPSTSSTPNVASSDKKQISRSAGKPTNIVATGKMDRKTLKRLRNRVSASRCRIKKKEWISEMEDESNALNNENRALMKRIATIEDSIANAKNTLMLNGAC